MSEELDFDELENFVNSDLVANDNLFSHYIKKSYGQSFMAYELIKSLDFDINPEDLETALEDIPSVVVFGNYSDPTKFVSMTFFTYDYELEEDEPLEITGEKFKKNVFKLKNIIEDMDFCMISYPILNNSTEYGMDSVDKYGLETIIFNEVGFLGGAYSKKEEQEIAIQFLIPENKMFPYKEITKRSYRNKNKEARMFARVLKEFHELPSFASKESLNSLVDEIKKDKIKIITHSNAIKEELRSEIVSLPLEGFVVVDADDRNKEEWEQFMINMLAKTDTEKEEVSELIDLVNSYFENSGYAEEE